MEQEFHNKRKPLYLDINTLLVKFPTSKHMNSSHAKWFSESNIPFTHTVRGYYLEDECVMLYWNNFEVPNINTSLFSYIFEYFPTIKWLGLGCHIGKIGESWKPIYKVYRENV